METITIPIKEYANLVERAKLANYSAAQAIISDKDFIAKLMIVSNFIGSNRIENLEDSYKKFPETKMSVAEYRQSIEQTRREVAEGKVISLEDFLSEDDKART